MRLRDGQGPTFLAAERAPILRQFLRVAQGRGAVWWRSVRRALVVDRLALRVAAVALAIAFLMSLAANTIRFQDSLERQKGEATQVIIQMERVVQHRLAMALWEFDFDAVEHILDGLMLNRDVGHLELHSPTGHRWSRGAVDADPEVATFDLSVTNAITGKTEVGTLELHITFQAIKARMWQEIWVAVLTTVGLGVLGAAGLVVALQRMVFRHTARVTRHLTRVRPVDPLSRLHLDRRYSVTPDGLDQLVTALQGYEARIEGHVDKLNDVIAQRERSEAEVQQAMQRYNQFLSTVGQDIRAPLHSISGLFEMIQNSDDVPEHHRQQAAVGHRASRRMGVQLINMLDLALLDSEDLTPQIRATPLQPLVEGWAALATDLAAERQHDIAVEVTLDQGLSAAYDLDAACVSRVMECLIDNATKFCQRGMLGIELRACLMEHDETSDVVLPVTCSTCSGLAILVRDCGPVIEFEHHERIFERFTRVDEHLTRKTEGAGLGLALARRFAEVMGGSLKIRECTDPRFHNEFLLCLPAVSATSPL